MSDELQPLDAPQLQTILTEMLPQPLQQSSGPDGSLRLIGGDPGEVVVELKSDHVIVSEYAVAEKKLQPVSLGSLNWAVLPAWTTRRILGELTAAAAAGRREKFVECVRCRKFCPPETMSDGTTCETCEASDEGVVY